MNQNKNISKIALIVSNLIPIIGVIFFSWDASLIIFLYWMENITIGIINIVKMSKSKGEYIPMDLRNEADIKKVNFNVIGKFLLIPFFVFHYGMFTLVHGIFVITLFKMPDMAGSYIVIAFISIFISHFISYKTNYIGKEEYLKKSPQELMMEPYKRIMVMHLTIIFGGFLAQFMGQPTIALIIMIILKIIVDLKLHEKEHFKFNNGQTTETPSISF